MNERLVRQLDDVRKGLHRLLSEDESDSQIKEDKIFNFKIGYHNNVNESVIEKQEVEYPEKNMGCISGEREEGGTDSGIEREGGTVSRLFGRSRSKLNSTGQSSESETSTTEERRRRESIDREGGFLDVGLEQRVRELWVRLAQMEAEKLRAVEDAVEEERRTGKEALDREKFIMEEERTKIFNEREDMKREREAMELKYKHFIESQERESDLVNKLQVC